MSFILQEEDKKQLLEELDAELAMARQRSVGNIMYGEFDSNIFFHRVTTIFNSLSSSQKQAFPGFNLEFGGHIP